MVRFNWAYFLATVGLLLLEIWIAVAMHDAIIRPYGAMRWPRSCFFAWSKAFCRCLRGGWWYLALLTSYLIEGLQYVHLLHYLGLEHFRLARIVFGSSFEWIDMLAYTLGRAGHSGSRTHADGLSGLPYAARIIATRI